MAHRSRVKPADVIVLPSPQDYGVRTLRPQRGLGGGGREEISVKALADWADDLIIALKYQTPDPGFIWYSAVTDSQFGLQSNWVAGAVEPQWRLDSSSIIWMRGDVTGGPSNSSIFTLPGGFRPEVRLPFEAPSQTVVVNPSGVVSSSVSSGSIELSSISFSADGE